MLAGRDDRAAPIYEPIKAELAQVGQHLRRAAEVKGGPPPQLLDHVIETGGKRVRPAITLLAARFHPNDFQMPIIMATAVELLHIATLIHDDTVDNAALRRGKATASNLWGRNVAVLLGDYVFATSATFVCDTCNVRAIRRFSETIMELSSGELLEYFNTFNWQQTREDYCDRIYRKTASLFSTAAETGAILSGAAEEVVQALKSYGRNIGMAFQIVDDILDVLGTSEEMGKPVGNDLQQGVLTLPAIVLMERYPNDNPVKTLFQNRGSDGGLTRALEMIRDSRILDECYAVVGDYCSQAVNALAGVEACPARRSLMDLVDYVTERTR